MVVWEESGGIGARVWGLSRKHGWKFNELAKKNSELTINPFVFEKWRYLVARTFFRPSHPDHLLAFCQSRKNLLSLPLQHSRHYEDRAQLVRRRVLLSAPVLLFHIQRLRPSLHDPLSQSLHVLRTDVADVNFDESGGLILFTTSLAGYQFSVNGEEKRARTR